MWTKFIIILTLSTWPIECLVTKPMVSKTENATIFVNETRERNDSAEHEDKKIFNTSSLLEKELNNSSILTTEASKNSEHESTIGDNINGIKLQSLPYNLGTFDEETANKTAKLIEMINNIDVKQIIPLIVSSGLHKLAYPGRIRRNYRRKRPYGNFLKVPSPPPSYLRTKTTPRLVNRPKEKKSYWLASEDHRVRSLGLIKKPGNFDRRRNDDQPLVFLLQPDLKLNDYENERRHFISNPEVIEEYMTRRRSRRRRKKHRSTSSDEDDNDSGDGIFRRMSNTGNDEEYGGENRAKSSEEVTDRNYNDRSEEYVITTKKGVWDYEHEDWADVNKKIDSKKESHEDSQEGRARYNRIPNKYKVNDQQKTLNNIDVEYKNFEDKKHKSVVGRDAIAKVESILQDTGVGIKIKKKEIWPESKTTQSQESEPERTTRKKKYSKEKKEDDWSREKEKNIPGPSHQSDERQEETIKNNHRIKNNEETENKWYKNRIEKKMYDERDNGNKRDDKVRIKKKVNAKREEKRRPENEKSRDDDVYTKRNVNYPKKQERYHFGSRERPSIYHNRENSKDVHRTDRYSNDRDNTYKRNERSDLNKYRNSNTDYGKRSREYQSQRYGDSDRNSNDYYERKRYKKSQLRHVESVNDWGNGKSVDWGHRSNEDLRSNKKGWTQYWNKKVDISKNNENFNSNRHKSNAKNLNKEKKVDKKKNKEDREDFWNRHAHNDWSKVGVGDWGNKKPQRAVKERFPLPLRITKGSVDVFDRHGNNQWDQIGRHDDYQDRVSFDSKPQSHRSQNSGNPIYFGYVHTSLPFKGKETVFDDK